jgi:hypothetical protein
LINLDRNASPRSTHDLVDHLNRSFGTRLSDWLDDDAFVDCDAEEDVHDFSLHRAD